MVETSATGRTFPGWEDVAEDIIPDADDTRDLGADDKRWAYIYAVIAILTSLTLGGIYLGATTEGWLFINASTEINGSLNISEDLFVNGTLTAGNVDITNLTVENMNFTNLTITGDIFNISATETYVNDLFPNEYCTFDLGSIGLRWDNGYFCHNVSAEYFIGNGSQLTDITLTETDPYWTANQSSYFNTTDILGFNYWNSTFATFNKTYADTLYYDIGNSFNYWNSTFATFNKTYADTLYSTILEPLWTANSTLVPYLASANVFTAGQNLTGQNITAIDCIIFDSGGKICSGV